MKRSLFILILIYPLLFSTAQKPNIIVVLADDIGTGDISHYRRMHSSNIILETPNIDALAKEGMVFTDAHSPAALCAPSRYGVMTGNSCYRSSALWGVWGSYEESKIKDTDLTLGRLMQKAGYHTSFFGKWNLGANFKRKSNPSQIYRAPRVAPELDVDITKMLDGPQQKGFDYDFTFPSGIQDVPYATFENGIWQPLKEDSYIDHITQAKMDKLGFKLDKDEGLGDSNWDPHDMGPIIVNKAVDFINTNANQEKPFFMYYCALAVHLPHTPCKTLNGIDIAGTTPSKHMDMIKELDVQMGMLVDALKAKGVYENTLIIFTSDNGGLGGINETNNSGHRPSDIYRGSKNSRYEGGHRVPFIAHWPNQIDGQQTSGAPLLTLDIAATLADITETEIGSGQALDSYNAWPIMQNDSMASNHAFIITQGGTGKELTLIEDGWKLIIQTDKTGTLRTPIALYDLNTNVQEKEDQNFVNKAAYKDRVETMLEKYNQIRNSKVPTFNMGTGVDTTIQQDTVTIETLNYVDLQKEFLASTTTFKISLHYAAKEARDISLEIKTPAGKYVKHTQQPFPSGTYDTTIVLSISNPLPAAKNYNIALALRPTGMNWQHNIEVVKTTFDLVESGTSVNEISPENDQLKLYPNPLLGDSFYLDHKSQGKWAFLKIHDLNGALMYQQIITGDKTQHVRKKLAPGSYLVTINNDKHSQTEILVVK